MPRVRAEGGERGKDLTDGAGQVAAALMAVAAAQVRSEPISKALKGMARRRPGLHLEEDPR